MPCGGVLHGGQLGQQPYRALGCLVLRTRSLHRHQPKLGRDVDDRAASGFEHRADRNLRAEEHALGVDIHHAVPVGLRGLVYESPPTDSGVVDENVQTAEPVQRRADRRAPVRTRSSRQAERTCTRRRTIRSLRRPTDPRPRARRRSRPSLPHLANSAASTAPMPRAPPLMNATFSFNRNWNLLHRGRISGGWSQVELLLLTALYP